VSGGWELRGSPGDGFACRDDEGAAVGGARDVPKGEVLDDVHAFMREARRREATKPS
jgi:hypothetical protein